jgi:Arc/MetJ-type ribon-helix-helix transcriptional regulator
VLITCNHHMTEVASWFSGRLPEWFEGAPQVHIDRDEILVIGTLATPEVAQGQQADEVESGRIARFREDTRSERMRIADEAEARFGRKVAWGARCGGTQQVFTSLAVPVMTRLRQPERQVLDTLVAAGVARSRSDALAWAVRLVGKHEADWIEGMRAALAAVEQARAAGPAA